MERERAGLNAGLERQVHRPAGTVGGVHHQLDDPVLREAGEISQRERLDRLGGGQRQDGAFGDGRPDRLGIAHVGEGGQLLPLLPFRQEQVELHAGDPPQLGLAVGLAKRQETVQVVIVEERQALHVDPLHPGERGLGDAGVGAVDLLLILAPSKAHLRLGVDFGVRRVEDADRRA